MNHIVNPMTNKIPGLLGERIRTLRLQRGWTQQQLGDRLGVAGITISSWEKGRNSPTVATLGVIAEAFTIPVSELFTSRNDLRQKLIPQAQQIGTPRVLAPSSGISNPFNPFRQP